VFLAEMRIETSINGIFIRNNRLCFGNDFYLFLPEYQKQIKWLTNVSFYIKMGKTNQIVNEECVNF